MGDQRAAFVNAALTPVQQPAPPHDFDW